MTEIAYARSGGFSIAFTVFGDGPADLVFVPGMISNVELIRETPLVSDFLPRARVLYANYHIR